MDPAYLNLVTSWFAIASAAALLIVAIAIFSTGRSRPWGALAFASFLILWPIQIVAANVAATTPSPSTGATFYLTSFAASLPLPFLILAFAAEQRTTSRRTSHLLAGLAAAVALAAALIFVTSPGLILEGVEESDGVVSPLWGTLYGPLVVSPFFLALSFAIDMLSRAHKEAPTPRIRSRTAILLAGLGIYSSFLTGSRLSYLLLWRLPSGLSSLDSSQLVIFLLLAMTLGIAVVRLSHHHAPVPRWLIASLVLPAIWGAGETIVRDQFIPYFDTVGLWRLAGAAIMAYGLLRLRIVDLPQRARGWAARTAGVGGALAAGAATYGVGAAVSEGVALPAAAGALVTLALAVPGLRLARKWLAPKPPANENDDRLFGSRLEAYRAALEASVARRTEDEDASFLASLRERFGIGEEAHRVLLHYARSAVVSAREGNVEGAYERLRLLGEGGAGRTWLARDRVRDRIVVLKEPFGDWHGADTRASLEASLREARLAARVRHRNVVRIEEVVTTDRAAVIVMEYVEGGSLADLLRARGALPWRDAVRITVGVLEGLDAVHRAGILHRDVKPSNILLTREGEPRIADFGIAAPLSSGKTRILESEGTTRGGTLSYMAPEVVSGATLGSVRSDVYAAAALLHACLFGSPPAAARVPIVVGAHEVPPRVAAVLARALSTAPEDRPASARAFAEALLEASA
jgi:hypothetical protein